jgi:hypothetical protein
MNKIFTISLSLLLTSIGYSQNTPTSAASSPTKSAANVISLFSNSYTNVSVDTWRTPWSAATLTDTSIVGNNVKKYSGLDYVGIEMITNRLNITAMDSFEFDLWTPNSTTFKFKLVDFGADTSYGGGDDKEHELSITPSQNGWNHISVPISAFTGLTTKANIAQLIFASVPSGSSIVYIDNVMFSKNEVVAEPTVAAPAPTKPASNVISLFSNSYTNVSVDTWRTPWSVATLTETQIASNDVKKYSGLDFVGIEMITKRLNITAMDSFEFDLWTPNSTTFKFKLVDFGADTSYGGGDDKEHELSITPSQNGWNHISVPISAFTGLTTKANIAQLIFASVPSGSSIVYIDNVLFSKKMQTSLSSAFPERVGIHPNPVNNILNINAEHKIQRIVIYNSMGQVVLNSSPETLHPVIQLTDLPNGVYFVQVTVNGVDTFSKISKE